MRLFKIALAYSLPPFIFTRFGIAHIDCDEIIQAYAGEIFQRLSADGQTIVLMLDQSKINEFKVLAELENGKIQMVEPGGIEPPTS